MARDFSPRRSWRSGFSPLHTLRLRNLRFWSVASARISASRWKRDRTRSSRPCGFTSDVSPIHRARDASRRLCGSSRRSQTCPAEPTSSEWSLLLSPRLKFWNSLFMRLTGISPQMKHFVHRHWGLSCVCGDNDTRHGPLWSSGSREGGQPRAAPPPPRPRHGQCFCKNESKMST